MTSRLNPYISFRDQAREAMDFYQSVFGGELTRTTFGEGAMSEDPVEKDRIMHSQLETPAGYTLMVADTPNPMAVSPINGAISISLSGDDEAELRGYFDKLAEGGEVGVPMEKAPWGDTFGMLTDRFGVGWLVNVAGS
jgi:PhnB protein